MAIQADLPVIDVSEASSGGDDAKKAKLLVDAAAEHGFVYVKSTDLIAPQDVDRAFAVSQKLFDAPFEEKSACSIQTNNRGWSRMHSEALDPKTQSTGDYKEAFNFGEFQDGKAQQGLPKTIQQDESFVSSFKDQCQNLCTRLLHLLGLGLEVQPPDFFSTAHLPSSGESGTTLRFLFYPPQKANSSSEVRAGAHSDYGSITLLFRLPGQAGLELLTPNNEWASVPVHPPGTENDPCPPILLNIGDLLSYWTNGLFRSTVHRVVFSGVPGSAAKEEVEVESAVAPAPRYSIAYFCHPAGSVSLDAVPSERVKLFNGGADSFNANPYAERKVLTADEHLQMRLTASYGELYKSKAS